MCQPPEQKNSLFQQPIFWAKNKIYKQLAFRNIYFIGVSIDSLHTISVWKQTPILLPCKLKVGVHMKKMCIFETTVCFDGIHHNNQRQQIVCHHDVGQLWVYSQLSPSDHFLVSDHLP